MGVGSRFSAAEQPAIGPSHRWLAVATLLAGAVLASNWYWLELQEHDSYAEALGMVLGAVTGRGSLEVGHYLPAVGYGYPRLLYLIGSPFDLTNRDTVVLLMNIVGHVSAVLVFPLLWLVLNQIYGRNVAWVSTLLFVFSPIFLEVSTSAHQILLSFVLLLISFLLMIEVSVRFSFLSLFASLFVSFLSLTIRLEAALVFPWLVLAHVGKLNWRAVWFGMFVRVAICVGALAAFYVGRHLLVPAELRGEQGSFFASFYDMSNVPKGIMAALLAVGVASGVVAAFLVALLFARLLVKRWKSEFGLLISTLGPLALAFVTLSAWLMNPIPARHFLFFALAVSILIGIALSVLTQWRRRVFVLAAIGLSLLNQAAAEAMAPVARRLSPSKTFESQPINAGVPVSNAWYRRRVRGRLLEAGTALGDDVARLTCYPRLVVISDAGQQLLLSQFRGAPPLRVTFLDLGEVNRARAIWPNRTVDYMYRTRGQQTDLIARVLADPDYADAKIVVDPLARLLTDSTNPPPSRTAVACPPRG